MLEVDQANVRFHFSDPTNARWTESEDGAIKTLSFNAEFPVPNDLPDHISPFIATVHNITNLKAYQHEENLRQQWIKRGWPYCERLLVHYEKGDSALFDKVARFDGSEAHDNESRLRLLGQAIERAFYTFTVDRAPHRAKIRQRIALAQSISEVLFSDLSEQYAKSGRMVALWQQITAVRRLFTRIYPSISPLLQMRYWDKQRQDLNEFKIAHKNFAELKAFLVDCFETLCKLLVPACGIEGIIHLGTLSVPTKKGQMSLWEFEAMDNGNKHTILRNLPISDLFLPSLNSELRNGVGHHSAHYDAQNDEVVYYKFKGSSRIEKRIGYTEFCDFCLRLFSAFELAVIYHYALHLQAKGAM